MYKKMRNCICLIIFTLLMTSCGNKELEDYEAIKSRGYIVMGMDDSFAPMGFRDEDGELIGFDVDLAKKVFDILDLEVKFQPIDWSMKERELENGNIDVIWNGYSINDERKAKVLFSQAYLENKQIIMTLSESKIENKVDLRGKKVAVQNGSSSLDALRGEEELVRQFDGGEAILFDTNHEALLDLEAGRSDALVSDEVLIRYYISKKNPEDYKIIADNFGTEEYGIGFRKIDKDLCEDVNKALNKLFEDGTYDDIYNKWLAR